jgi:hypothetical protein
MSIKQNGGVFGRNPTFNDVTIEGQLTFDGDIDINSDLKVDGDLDVTGSSSVLGSMAIGSGTPSVKFHVNGGTANQIGLFESTDANVKIGFKDSATTNNYSVTIGAVGDEMTFSSGSGGTERIRVNSVGNVTVSTGNLVIGTSGKGIDFSATSGTGTSELFSDYEEGSWTSLVGGTATYGANSGRYTKIGRQVMATFDLNITLIGTGSTSTITGLPFATADAIAEGVSVNFFDGLTSSVVELNAYVINSEIRFRSLTAAGTGLSNVAVLGDSCRVTGTAIYTV